VNVAGSFKNGGGATAANHAATYSKHGSIQMDTDSTLGITSTSSVVSASQLVAYPNATLSTPYVQTSGLINLSRFRSFNQ
jgi:trimeric autotransporter adhesin